MSAQEITGILLSLTAFCSYVNYKFVKLPKSIGITLVALFLTLLITLTGLIGWEVSRFAESFVDRMGFNETFLHGMLSFLLFAGSLHINTAELYKYKLLIAAFSTISVLISTLLIGYATYGLLLLLGISLPFYYCFVFGALISPTDAITVIGVLKTSKLPKSLEMKIYGEALFNDGMSIVLFFMALALATGTQESLEVSEITLYFLKEGGGGLVTGLIMGWLAAKLFATIEDHDLVIILTLALVTGGYTFATSILDVSGPICMAVTGLIIGNSFQAKHVNKDTVQRVYAFWDLLDDILNAILFVLIGFEFMSINFNWSITLASMGAIIIALGARFISVTVPSAFIAKFKSNDRSVPLIMTWGGLRGGISIALALGITGEYRDTIVSITYAIVLFSIMVQGLTLKPLIKKLTHSKAFD